MASLSRPAEPDQDLVPRYRVTQRAAHWWIAVTFALTVLTAPEDSGDRTQLIIHISCASALVLGALAIGLLGDRKALGADLRVLFWFDETDRIWLRSLTKPKAPRPTLRWGKFNAGQKVAAWLTLLGIMGLLATGALDAVLGHPTIHPPIFALTALLLVGHVAMAVLNPVTRPALRGMLLGAVSREWARKHHSGWLDEVDAQQRR
jgi:formate dehydrogenase subunit gamma